jgi:hypothetical protein
MKTVPASKGPFPKRPYYTDDDIEQICSDALAETNLLPGEPSKVRIDRFIEKKFDVRIIFESLPANVLGFTVFGPKGVEAIHVAEPKEYLDTPQNRRINSTLAHEAGHDLLHAHLFTNDDNSNLFEHDPDVTQTRVLCRKQSDRPTDRQRTYDGRWWEFQANRAIGALLMPQQPFLSFIRQFLDKFGNHGTSNLPLKHRDEAIKASAETFDVNPAVARIRIDSMFFELPKA